MRRDKFTALCIAFGFIVITFFAVPMRRQIDIKKEQDIERLRELALKQEDELRQITDYLLKEKAEIRRLREMLSMKQQKELSFLKELLQKREQALFGDKTERRHRVQAGNDQPEEGPKQPSCSEDMDRHPSQSFR